MGKPGRLFAVAETSAIGLPRVPSPPRRRVYLSAQPRTQSSQAVRTASSQQWRVHGGDPIARAGEVLALVPELSSAAPVQDQQRASVISPCELALAMPVGRPEIRVPDSDMRQRILAETVLSRPTAPKLRWTVHVSLPTAGSPESMRAGNTRRAKYLSDQQRYRQPNLNVQ